MKQLSAFKLLLLEQSLVPELSVLEQSLVSELPVLEQRFGAVGAVCVGTVGAFCVGGRDFGVRSVVVGAVGLGGVQAVGVGTVIGVRAVGVGATAWFRFS